MAVDQPAVCKRDKTMVQQVAAVPYWTATAERLARYRLRCRRRTVQVHMGAVIGTTVP
jgi:hypothetical protein